MYSLCCLIDEKCIRGKIMTCGLYPTPKTSEYDQELQQTRIQTIPRHQEKEPQSLDTHTIARTQPKKGNKPSPSLQDYFKTRNDHKTRTEHKFPTYNGSYNKNIEPITP